MDDVIILNEIIITALIKAKQTLDEALAMENNAIVRDACIQRFEYTYELTWKTLKRILKHKGLNVSNPRDVIREAAKLGLIDNPTTWFDFIACRDLTSHTYNETKANAVYAELPLFQRELSVLVNKIMAL